MSSYVAPERSFPVTNVSGRHGRMRVQFTLDAALNISAGPLALRTFQTAGPVRASTLYLSLALQDHRVKCRASRLKITVARSMTNFATFSCILFLKFRYVCIA